jgi:hypothetical protein
MESIKMESIKMESITSSKTNLKRVISTFFFSLLLMCSKLASAQSDEITVCNTCTSNVQYSQHAIASHEIIAGQPTDVYVVNLNTQQVRPFTVELTITSSGFGGEEGIAVNVVPITGNQNKLNDINTAMTVVEDIENELSRGISAAELGLTEYHNSAIALIGPGASELHRLRLRNSLQRHLNGFVESTAIDLADSIKGAIDKFLTSKGINSNGAVIVTYPDGTKVIVRIKSIVWTAALSFDSELVFEFEVDLSSINHETIAAFPQNASSFSGFTENDLAPDLVRALQDLALRFGIEVSSPENPQACSTNMVCNSSIDNGQCTIVLNC